MDEACIKALLAVFLQPSCVGEHEVVQGGGGKTRAARCACGQHGEDGPHRVSLRDFADNVLQRVFSDVYKEHGAKGSALIQTAGWVKEVLGLDSPPREKFYHNGKESRGFWVVGHKLVADWEACVAAYAAISDVGERLEAVQRDASTLAGASATARAPGANATAPISPMEASPPPAADVTSTATEADLMNASPPLLGTAAAAATPRNNQETPAQMMRGVHEYAQEICKAWEHDVQMRNMAKQLTASVLQSMVAAEVKYRAACDSGWEDVEALKALFQQDVQASASDLNTISEFLDEEYAKRPMEEARQQLAGTARQWFAEAGVPSPPSVELQRSRSFHDGSQPDLSSMSIDGEHSRQESPRDRNRGNRRKAKQITSPYSPSVGSSSSQMSTVAAEAALAAEKAAAAAWEAASAAMNAANTATKAVAAACTTGAAASAAQTTEPSQPQPNCAIVEQPGFGKEKRWPNGHMPPAKGRDQWVLNEGKQL